MPIVGVSIAVLWWSAAGTRLSIADFIAGLPWIADFVGRMLPPNFAFMEKLVRPAIETVQIALWGTLLGIVLAVPDLLLRRAQPLALCQGVPRAAPGAERDARHQRDHPGADLRGGRRPRAVRRRAGHRRCTAPACWASSSPRPIEEIDEGPLEALRAAGAGTLQRIVFGVLPQVLPAWIGVVLYRFETNLRVSTVLGMVGAGGIGFELISCMKLFAYEDTAACVIVILVLVLVADLLSSKLQGDDQVAPAPSSLAQGPALAIVGRRNAAGSPSSRPLKSSPLPNIGGGTSGPLPFAAAGRK